jgi:hypothetical protein
MSFMKEEYCRSANFRNCPLVNSQKEQHIKQVAEEVAPSRPPAEKFQDHSIDLVKEAWMQTTKSRERREHKVSVESETVEYSVISSSHTDFYYGIFTDISAVGMCLLTTSPLKRGEKIVFRSNNPTSKVAVVLWSGIGAFFYKAGLKFV